MSIIKLEEPWAFFASEEITQGELEELQKHFVDSSNDCYSWETDRYNGITGYGKSNYFGDIAPKSERYLATMKFFEQLREPERSEAIANYDEDYDEQIPETLADALELGFCWKDSPQGNDYWEEKIHRPVDYGIYFEKEELFVFGKYKVGDTVVLQVCTDRYPMFKVSKDSTPDKMIDETGAHSTNPGSFRPATPEEIEAYNQGIRNVADIKPKLTEFPSEGSCKTNDNRLEEYLKKSDRTTPKGVYDYSKAYACWNTTSYWRADTSSKPEHQLSQLEPFLLDIKPNNKRAVKFNSEEERRHILAHFNPYHISLSGVNKGWICLEDGTWSSGWDTFEKDKYTEMSFQDWCKEANHPFDYKESVHCTTQEEWDFVLSKFNPSELTSENFKEEGKQSTITIKNTNDSCIGCYADVEYDVQQGFTILTFKQWCEKYGHSYEVVPEYVECIKSLSNEFTRGKLYTWPYPLYNDGNESTLDILDGGLWKFKPSTKEAYDKQQEKLKMEELLSEAKRRYPIGTKFKCLVSNSIIHEVKDLSLFIINMGHIFYEHQMICDGIRWTEIIKEELKPTEIKPAKGMYVRCLKENSWSDGKTKAGQVFVIEDVDWSGDMWVNNQSFAKERLGRGEFELLPDYKEEPWVAQVGDWVYVLEKDSAFRLTDGHVGKCVDIFSKNVICVTDKVEGYRVRNGNYRKATQEEIDSVNKPFSEGLVLPLVTAWTADNWYVEVTSQEEANAVIDAAAKMYGRNKDLGFNYESRYSKVGADGWGEYCLLEYKEIGDKSPRPITDFVQPEKPTLLETVKKTFFDKPIQQTTPDYSYLFAGEVTEEEFDEIKKLCRPQQDELVIYKPKRVIL